MAYPFIVFEGGEGSGKSTQARLLYRRLVARNVPVLLTHEPGGTPLGSALRHYLKKGGIRPLAELLLFAASRAQLLEEIVRPGLERGVVISDRYVASTIVYQGWGRGLEREVVDKVNAIATGGLEPDITILLDIPPEEGLARKGKKRGDAFEGEDRAFHQRVRKGYLSLADAGSRRWLVVDATLPRSKVGGIVWRRVWRDLEARGLV